MELGELRVVTQNSPSTYYYGAEERRGIEYELARAFADRLGVRLRMTTPKEFWRLFPAVTSGDAHIAAAGLTATEPRRAMVDFGPSYQHVEPVLIYRMGTRRPHSIEQVQGGNLEVLAGSSHVGLLRRLRESAPDLQWAENRAVSAEVLVRRVAQGDIDYAIVNSNELKLLRHYYPEVQVAFELESGRDLAWALPRNAPELREKVESFFAEIQATGELQSILDRYYYAARDFDFVGSRAFVRHLNARFPHYQAMFQEAELETGVDWRLLAAISYQESHWNADAVSPTGVRGLMMLTEKTAQMMQVDTRDDPRESIIGGARYFRRVLDKFPERIPTEDRLLLAVAAYNIGFGHVEDARIITEIRGADPDSWDDVRESLPLLSDEAWYSRVRRGYAPGSVPVQYVDNVRRYRALLEWMAGTEVLSAVPESDTAAPVVETGEAATTG
jgi:membrane-bound lytic murein transglycosylase F